MDYGNAPEGIILILNGNHEITDTERFIDTIVKEGKLNNHAIYDLKTEF